MEKKIIIEEYRRLFERQKEIDKEMGELMMQVNRLKNEHVQDVSWMRALAERFDNTYGCKSPGRPYNKRLDVYFEDGEEVPE